MNRLMNKHQSVWLAIAAWLLAVGPALSAPAELPQHKNHAFDVVGAGAIACLDGVVFDGEATGASSLNLLMTSQVFDQVGTTLLATGNTHTFTAVGESFTFTVTYPTTTFNVGDAVGISVSDVPGSLQGTQGDFANSPRVADCSIASVPTVPGWGLTLLAFLLLVAGAAMMHGRTTNAGEARA